MCGPELMRILMDEEKLTWEEAWGIVTKTISYTNHTILPEALEKWPIATFSKLLPRIYGIIDEINRRWRDFLTLPRKVGRSACARPPVLWDGEVRIGKLVRYLQSLGQRCRQDPYRHPEAFRSERFSMRLRPRSSITRPTASRRVVFLRRQIPPIQSSSPRPLAPSGWTMLMS